MKIKLAGNRLAQIACTQQNGGAALIQAKDGADLAVEVVHIVAIALQAKAAKAVQVLTDLACGQVHAVGQLFGRDAGDAIMAQVAQKAAVAGKTLDDRGGNGRFFGWGGSHRCHPFQTGMG